MIKTQKNCPETGKVLSSVFTRSYGYSKVGAILCFFFSPNKYHDLESVCGDVTEMRGYF